jgi:hypothetical protein
LAEIEETSLQKTDIPPQAPEAPSAAEKKTTAPLKTAKKILDKFFKS